MSVLRFYITAHQACRTAVNSYTNMNNGAELCVCVCEGGVALLLLGFYSKAAHPLLYIFINTHRKKAVRKRLIND